MVTALVLSAGGLYGAWEVGVWKALRTAIPFDVIVGSSAGAFNGWAIAGGASVEELAAEWLDPLTAEVMQPLLHSTGILNPEGLHRKARELYERFRPRVPFGLTIVELPWLRPRLVRETEITWQHLAATCSIPLCYPPVRIQGRDYVDGGLVGALPLWAAERMGAERAIGVNVLNQRMFRCLYKVFRPPRPGPQLKVFLIEPSQPLGRIKDAVVWSKTNIEQWIRLGEEDGNRALTSITM